MKFEMLETVPITVENEQEGFLFHLGGILARFFMALMWLAAAGVALIFCLIWAILDVFFHFEG